MICVSTGDMTKKVKKRARPIMTWFGGICCVASALRTKESTITMRVKEVTRIINAGARLTTAKSNKSRSVPTNCNGSSPVPTCKFMSGMGIVGWARATSRAPWQIMKTISMLPGKASHNLRFIIVKPLSLRPVHLLSFLISCSFSKILL